MIGCAQVTSHVRSVINIVIASQEEVATIVNANRTLQDMSTAVQADPYYVRLHDCIVSGFPTNREVGVPLRLRTDGGPQFTSREFADFAEHWGVHPITSSPHYPKSNGHAEAAVKAVKHLILKTAPSGNTDCEAFDRGLLELRNMPNHSGRSPAQILYGHPLRTCVPAHPQSFMECWQEKTLDCDQRAQVKLNYDAHARPLPRLNVGQHVRLQDPTSHRWDKIGIIMGGTRSREYEIRLPSGGVLRRNRRFLYPVPSPNQVPNSDLPVIPSSDIEKSSIPSTTSRRSPRLNRPT
ncbi:uncharacterized protein [Palaemon carinicauda]|uniref:uncharacterized protein n=1 Tax=Palaemon carinicauda TaxID=392227 RepID=UPI0035B5F4F2